MIFFFNLKTESKYHILQERQKLEYKARKKECQEWWKAMQARVKWQKNPQRIKTFGRKSVEKHRETTCNSAIKKKTADAMQRK